MEFRCYPAGASARAAVAPGRLRRLFLAVLGLICLLPQTGCWAPFRTVAVAANTLPEEFRTPLRTGGMPLNYANLTVTPPPDYLLGAEDVLDVMVPNLYPGAEIRPIRVQVMSNGNIHLPLVGPVKVGSLNLMQAQQAITAAYADGHLVDPRVSVTLVQKRMVSVLVLGEVNNPGVHLLPNYENDVGHALAAAGGLTLDADEMIEVHRRVTPLVSDEVSFLPSPSELIVYDHDPKDPKETLHIPLRGLDPTQLQQSDVILRQGDVIVVPSRRNEVFFVVGKLNPTNLVRFTLGDRERELGAGFILPRDREIDVVTAVAMAGYIDPIDSPTTVTVHRTLPNGQPFLIAVDLIAARYDRNENIFVQPGDIIYLNPDAAWWFRRTFDRVLGDLIVIPYARGVGP